ncbi:glycosylation-dependent cell adhesion molecule 1-like [Talpa occidentalis]|uniref:glycosylation-dependent cell adhesion molecule 1-like n=1 Tax=Talpa occidentalis TaxID=50954 RepID=UPI00188E5198|nr:glycosylation-dependent cell adhesion molecule 1-like [Talpa occidentalis]XP_037369189.1 glycosylation-dependent cell adhesion molecule 1-like [Talpa occidentalis]
MKFFSILLLASLASTSLTALHAPATQVTPSGHPQKDQAPKKDAAKEASISIEELFSQEEVVIKSIRTPKNPKPELPHLIAQANSFKTTHLEEKLSASHTLSEEAMTELTPTAATTSEEQLAKYSYEFGKKVEKEMKKLINYLKSLFPRISEVTKA